MPSSNTLRASLALLWRLCLLCALCANLAHASRSANDFNFLLPQLETIGDIDSIPEGVVTALAQDARGFIWIGTQMGLVRFDGYQFRKFIHNAKDPHSLAGNYVYSLLATKDGRLWVGTNSAGISVFDPASERFSHFSHHAKQSTSLADGRIWAMAADANGGIWVASDHGLSFLPANSQEFVRYQHDAANPSSLLSDSVRCLLLERSGRLLVGSKAGLQALAANRKVFTQVAGDAFRGKEVQSLFQAQDGKLWVGTADFGAAWLAPGTPTSTDGAHWLAVAANQTSALSNANITGIAQFNSTQIWLASYGGGINIVDASDGRVLQHLRHHPAVRNSLSHNMVVPLLLDRSGLLWIGTWAGGLQRFNTKTAHVRMLRQGQPAEPGSTAYRGLSHADVHSIVELANGQILLGTGVNGIDILDREHGVIGGYRGSEANTTPATPLKPKSLPDAAVYALAQSTDGSVWAGMRRGGVARLLPGSTVWQSIPGLPHQQVKRILQSREGDLWVATNDGVAFLKKELLNAPVPQAKFELGLDTNGKPMRARVYALAEDAQGRIWAGSDNGLWVLPAKGESARESAQAWRALHKGQSAHATGLNSDLSSGLLLDSTSTLWISTDQGLSRMLQWDGKQAQFDHVTARLIPPSARLGPEMGENLMQDSAARIWSEIAIVDAAKQQLYPLTRADGIDLGISWTGAYAKTRDGLLLFGGTLGVAVIDPAQFQQWNYMPPLVLTALKINGKNVAPGSLAMLNKVSTDLQDKAAKPSSELTLQPEQRDFAIEFAALDYSAPTKNRYQYRLEGYDKIWINADPEHRSATYGNLWPGQYTLVIRGSNRLGTWSEHTLQIPIRVLPAWWQTWWFGALLLLLTAGLFLTLLQARTHYLQQRQRELEKQVREATHEVEKSHHELEQSHQELAHSHQELEQSHEELADALQTLKATQAKLLQAERQHISLEIHDNLSQTMTGILLQLDSAREALLEDDKSVPVTEKNQTGEIAVTHSGLSYVERAIELARDGIKETRQLLIQLRSRRLKSVEIDLVEALRRELPRLTAGTPIQVLVEQQGLAIALPASLELMFFRVAQESVTNALRHSHAKLIHVLLDFQSDQVILQVRDNGRGFIPNAPNSTPGIGLLGMRERVTALAGRFEIDSALGQGCCITVTMPLPN